MKIAWNIKTAVCSLVAAFAMSANAHAVTLDAGIFDNTLGHVGNPVIINVPAPGTGNPGLFLDTINFDLGSFTYFNLTSTTNNIQFFGVPIFENIGDTEVIPQAASHFSVFLPDLGLSRDYHLHPQGLNGGGGSYQLAMWGSTAPVPVPAAIWLFGSGLAGVVGLARRKMSAV